MKKAFQPTILITLAAICCALVLGLFTVSFAGVFGDRLSLLLALPAVMIIGFIFFIDRYLDVYKRQDLRTMKTLYLMLF